MSSQYSNASTGKLNLPLIRLTGKSGLLSYAPAPWLYVFIFSCWLLTLAWFQPRLMGLLDMSYNIPSWMALMSFILFIDFAWLYGIYNVSTVLFAAIHKYFVFKPEQKLTKEALNDSPAVAILYTTCNDFVERSVLSCVQQNYQNYKVYILDDSSDADFKNKIDAFATKYPDRVEVVRRPNREHYKAGNLNYGLTHVATEEKYFAIADADEVLPPDFLKQLVPVLEADPKCGFAQANHNANPNTSSKLAREMSVGIDAHWKWYQPLRNDFGFVMFLGHGALLRRKCWEEIGGFPHIVSEDLGFAIHIRELGYRGRFVEGVVCYEDFPESVRSFRIRHMKWTRGTCEFLAKKFLWLVSAKNISWTEKLDVLFPTLNLPLTLLYFLFMINANLVIPWFFGKSTILTFQLGGSSINIPVIVLDQGFSSLYTADFFLITLMTFFAPVLCFIVALAHRPLKLFRFLSKSTALYAAIGPLSSLGVLAYMVSGKAIFLVTGDKDQTEYLDSDKQPTLNDWLRDQWNQFLHKSHPDMKGVQLFEISTGLIFAAICLYMFQISFLGLCLGFILLPIMHYVGWGNRWVDKLIYLPFVLILTGVGLAGMSLVGMQAVFFGYGFHF